MELVCRRNSHIFSHWREWAKASSQFTISLCQRLMSQIPRNYSDKFEQGGSDVDLLLNRNVDWMNRPFFVVSYAALVLLVFFVLQISQLFEQNDIWTIINVLHCVLTFFLLHWVKGNPDTRTQGAYDGLTVWEQIDAGTPWTRTKKVLMLVPTLITLLAMYITDYQSLYVAVNGGVFLVQILPKIPEMHRVRLFGINSTPGIDNEVEYSPKKKK